MKRLIICFDGTWNDADNGGGDTNVALISRSIHASIGTGGVYQSVLYLRGVGTSGLHAEKILEGATGLGIDDNIRSGYMFLAQNYLPGDEIFLFGFSRGSFTARSLVGLISAVGLLKRQSLGALGAAWTYYRSDKPHSPASFLDAQRVANSAKNVDSHLDARITFLGVWDTVGALGVPGHLLAPVNSRLYGFYDTGVCPIVDKACHALAIDEHRDSFVPTLWTGTAPPGVSIEQVWFAGVHADVGGGYAERGLSDIPLVWMARRAESAGLVLDWTCLPDPAKLDPSAPQHDSSVGLFAIDRLSPTLRRMCEKDFHVPFYQRIYAPLDANHELLSTVGEALHSSVPTRWKKTVGLAHSGNAPDSRITYAPANAGALISDNGGVVEGVRIAE